MAIRDSKEKRAVPANSKDLIGLSLLCGFFVVVLMYGQIRYNEWGVVAIAVLIMILNAVSVGLITRKEVKIVENKGVSTDFLFTYLIAVFFGVVISSVLLITYFTFNTAVPINLPVTAQFPLITLVLSYPITVGLPSILVFWMWERKNKKTLYANKNKIYIRTDNAPASL